jgi:hypothetical protein
MSPEQFTQFMAHEVQEAGKLVHELSLPKL